MKISNINGITFSGSIGIYGKICFHEPYCENEKDFKRNKDKIENAVKGDYIDASINGLIENEDTKTKDTFPFEGHIDFDTDRVCNIGRKEIVLISKDGKSDIGILYNETGDKLKQLMAIAAYNAASKNKVSIDLEY